MLAGSDNDYRVTQNADGAQRDVYFRFSDVDTYATSIQCPLGGAPGCMGAADKVPLDGSYLLLPGVLHAYTVSAEELDAFAAPATPEPGTYALMLAVLGAVATLARRRRRS